MTAKADDVFARTMSLAQREKASARAKKLVDEYETLQALRKALGRTQVELAERLGIGQDNVSRLERRDDFLVSTLRSYVAALGGELELTVRFPDRDPVSINQLLDSADSKAEA